MTSLLRPTLLLLALLTLLTGVLYPAAVTGAAQLLFRRQAGGSLLVRQGVTVGSELVGQAFADPGHFWSRPSALTPRPYDARTSGGSNLGPTNPDLARVVAERVAALRASDPGQAEPIPVDLVTASASGLDPHLSPAAALWQVPRVARARALPEAAVRQLVQAAVEPPSFGVLGAPRVSVVRLNLDLEELSGGPAPGVGD
jgi:K+-transporting ATPase ATPase C chain